MEGKARAGKGGRRGGERKGQKGEKGRREEDRRPTLALVYGPPNG